MPSVTPAPTMLTFSFTAKAGEGAVFSVRVALVQLA